MALVALWPGAALAQGSRGTQPAYGVEQIAGVRKDFLPVAVAADGSVLGYKRAYVALAGNALGEQVHIYLVSPQGRVRELAQPSGVQDLVPTGMNDGGAVIGEASSEQAAYVYAAGSWRAVGANGEGDPLAINDGGQITGIDTANGGAVAFLGAARGGPLRVLGTLPCGCGSIGRAISPAGLVVGDVDDHLMHGHAAIFPASGKPLSQLPVLPATRDSSAYAVNGHGQVAGTFNQGNGDFVFLYDGALHVVGVVGGMPVLDVNGIDAAGRIVGTAWVTAQATGSARAYVAGAGGVGASCLVQRVWRRWQVVAWLASGPCRPVIRGLCRVGTESTSGSRPYDRAPPYAAQLLFFGGGPYARGGCTFGPQLRPRDGRAR
jgi:hypothetical protein